MSEYYIIHNKYSKDSALKVYKKINEKIHVFSWAYQCWNDISEFRHSGSLRKIKDLSILFTPQNVILNRGVIDEIIWEGIDI